MAKTLSGVTNYAVSNTLRVNKVNANGSLGSNGQILVSNGTSPYWSNLTITAGEGLSGGGTGTSLTLDVGAANGITVSTDAVGVVQGTGIVVNSSGVHVNSAYINTISSNNSSYLNGQPASYYTNATNLSSGTVAEARLPYRMDQNVRTTDSVSFNNLTLTGNLVVNGSTTVLQGNVVTFTDNMLYLNQGISATITNITSNGTHVIFTANNNYSAGWDVEVTGVDPSSYNGTYNNISAANATTFTVANTNTASYVSGGITRGKTDVNPDIGLAAGYNDGTYAHTGIFRDASDAYWKVFEGYTPEPDNSIFIDTSNASFTIAKFWADTVRVGNTSVYATINSTSFSGTANTANVATYVSTGTTTNTFTVGTASYFVSNGNLGIGNSVPTDKLSINGTSYFGANVTLNSGLVANGSLGTAGHVLHSNGSATYWAADVDTNTTYDLLTVANTTTNQGIVRLKDSSNANDDVTFVGANGIVVSSNSTQVTITSGLSEAATYDLLAVPNTAANEGIIRLKDSANANDNVLVTGAGGVVVSSNDTHVVITGQIGDITGVSAGAGLTGSGTSGDITLSVLANTGIIANVTGVYVNAAYIATIASNTANVANFVANGTTTNTFTVGTASYFVSNGNIGVGTSTPLAKLHIPSNIITGKVKQGPNLISKILKASDAATNDSYGRSVSISADGTTMAVGAPDWEGTTGTNRGGVYVYKWNGYAWVQQGSVIEASDAADSDGFGISVAVSTYGTVLAVGAANWEGATGTNRGGVYIYDWSGTAWVQRGSVLEAPDAADSDSFGTSLAFSILSSDGDVLFVGAPNWEGASGTNRGGVYVFDWSGTAWVQRGSVIEASDAADSDGFGQSISVAPTATPILVVGALNWEGASGTNRGGVYVFTESVGGWTQQGSVLIPSDAADSDNFGTAVSISGDGLVLAVSAEKTLNLGEVYIFDRSDVSSTTWIQRGSAFRAADESIGSGSLSTRFGSGVSLSYKGSLLLVGSTSYDNTQGGVYTYTLTGDLPIIADFVSGSGLVDSSGGAILRTAGVDRITFGSTGNVVFSNSADLVFSTNSGIFANGSIGTAGHVLHSNGTTVYWAADDNTNTTYDLLTVANTTTNQGIVRLKDSSNANDDVQFTGANGVVVSSNATHVLITGEINTDTNTTYDLLSIANTAVNEGIIRLRDSSNANDNVLVVGANGIVVSSNATAVLLTNQIIAGSGLSGSANTLTVLANTGIIANTTGVYVNATYIGTLSANNTTYLNGQLASYYTNATNITTGTLPYTQIPANIVNTTGSFTMSGVTTFSSNVVISNTAELIISSNAGIYANGSIGTSGQVLTSNGTTVYWAAASAGVNTAAEYTWTNTHIHANDKRLAFSPLAGGANVYFIQQNDDNFVFYTTNASNETRPVFNIYANSTTSNLNFNVPLNFNQNATIPKLIANSSLGGTGQILFSDGANTYWGTAPTGGIAPVTNIVTGTTVTAAKDNRYFLTNTSPTTVTLPATPSLGDTVYIVVTNSLANNVVARNGSKIMSLDEDLTLDIIYYSIGLTYLDTTRGWILV